MIVNRLLDAENTNLAQLVVQNPLAQGGLDDVGAVEACETSLAQIEAAQKESCVPVHAVCSHDRSLRELRSRGRCRGVVEEVTALPKSAPLPLTTNRKALTLAGEALRPSCR